MPEQLLNCHDVHASIHETRRKSVAQRVPRHTRNAGLPARESESSLEINKQSAGIVVVKHEVILSAERPSF
jgi:hypothetical protein